MFGKASKVHPTKDIYIATEDAIIKKFCDMNNMQCVITQKSNTAIERIKYFSDEISADSYINIQGDEPLVNIKDIRTILNYNIKYPNRIVFGKTKCDKAEFDDHSKAKVVCDLK